MIQKQVIFSGNVQAVFLHIIRSVRFSAHGLHLSTHHSGDDQRDHQSDPQGSRLVGIVSHVSELKERIDKKIIVTKKRTEDGIGSSICIES